MKRLALCLFLAGAAFGAGPNWEREFRNPPAEYRMGVYWWWFGPAQTKREVARELDVMKRAGIGRVLIYPVYPVAANDPARGIRNYQFLSAEFVDVLQYAVQRARAAGIEVSVPLGSGWPYGGPAVRPGQAAQRLRMLTEPAHAGAHLSPPALAPDETVVCRLLAPGDGTRVDLAAVKDVTAAAELPATLQGPHAVLTFVQSPTRMKVKRPALGGEGLVLDHLSAGALRDYLEDTGARFLPALGGKAAIHADSFEVFGQCWTRDLLREFQQRRGYDLQPYLPALFADAGEKTASVRHDFWLTIGDLAIDNNLRVLSEWAHAHGTTLQAESYGCPAIDMRGFRWIDQPMGESYDWKNFVASRWASSGAHQTGHRFVAAETWTWLRRPRYVSTLEDLKRGVDLQFACGVNRVVGHGYAYSPPEAGSPGWGYYASVMLNDRNPWWPYFHHLSSYVARASYALSLGKPRADVALYLPEDDVLAAHGLDSSPNLYKSSMNLYMETKDHLCKNPGGEFGLPAAMTLESPAIASIMAAGFNFDGIDRAILAPGLRVDRGRLELGDASYRIVVLPGLTGISLELLERLAEFCRAGGTVIATGRLPDRVYGLQNRQERQRHMQRIVGEMFGAAGAAGPHRQAYGKGQAIFVPGDTEEFRKTLAGLAPQVVMQPDPALFFVQRGEAGREVYFLGNTSAAEKRLALRFRDGKGRARRWDPMTGEIEDCAYDRDGRLAVTLEPYGTTVIGFDSSQPEARRQVRAEAAAAGTVQAIEGPWTLVMGGRPVRLERLESWTGLAGSRYFSGTATYTAEVQIEGRPGGAGDRAFLELGEVREIADVEINGKPAGVSWRLPHRVEVSGLLRPGPNRILIRVTNLPINQVLGQPEPSYAGLPKIQFPLPQEKKALREPLPSGLSGPVRLVWRSAPRPQPAP
jgi:hypothetical protein